MVQADEQLRSVRFYIGSNVEVAPDVAIAAGAVLEAAPGAALVIASGVCIGAGVVVQASGGRLVIETGVNLGRGVLIVGHGNVGTRTCIGTDSTLLNPQIASGTVIPARSLLSVPETSDSNGSTGKSSHTDKEATGEAQDDLSTLQAPTKVVYGRAQVEQLMKTLFPHRESLNGQNSSS